MEHLTLALQNSEDKDFFRKLTELLRSEFSSVGMKAPNENEGAENYKHAIITFLESAGERELIFVFNVLNLLEQKKAEQVIKNTEIPGADLSLEAAATEAASLYHPGGELDFFSQTEAENYYAYPNE